MSIHDVHNSAVIIAAGLVSNEKIHSFYPVTRDSVKVLTAYAYRIADALEAEKNRRTRKSEELTRSKNEAALERQTSGMLESVMLGTKD